MESAFSPPCSFNCCLGVKVQYLFIPNWLIFMYLSREFIPQIAATPLIDSTFGLSLLPS